MVRYGRNVHVGIKFLLGREILQILDLGAIAYGLMPHDTVRVKIALIIENRSSDYRTIKSYLTEIDPTVETLQFHSFGDLAYWFRSNFLPEHEDLKVEAEDSASEGAADDRSESQSDEAAPPSDEENNAQGSSTEEVKEEDSSDETEIEDDSIQEGNLQSSRPARYGKLSEGDQIVLLIANHKIFGSGHKLLLQKLGLFLKAKGLLAEDKKFLPALFTVSETDESFVIQDYLEPYINNFLFRPLDRLVCKAKILWALYGKDAISQMELYKEAASSLIEMRKDIQTLELSETGFKVLSSRSLKEGLFTKYYGPEFFNNSPKDGVFGIVHSSTPSANFPGQHEVELKFLGLDSKQIRAIRSKIEGLVDSYAREEHVPTTKSSPVGVVLLVEDKTISHQIKEQLEESFQNVDVKVFGNFVDFILNIDPEYGARELVEQQQSAFEEEFIEFRFNFDSDVFLETEPNASGDSLFGIPTVQLPSLKSFLLQQLPPENRPELLSFWSQGSEDSVYTMKVMLGGATCIISLFERKVEDTTLSFKIRMADLEEVKGYMALQTGLPKTIGAVFVSDRMAGYRDAEYWRGLKEKMLAAGFHSEDRIGFFRLAPGATKEHELAERHSAFDESFVLIVDHRYLTLRLSSMVRGLKFRRERPIELRAEFRSIIQSATLVSDLQVNEVNIIMRYRRSIGIGKYRYFTFWDPKSGRMEVFMSKCVETEKDPDNKGSYLNYFLLYGLTDPENAFLRNWMIEQYRLAKGADDKGA